MRPRKHGDLDDDGNCILSGLEPAFCGGCRDHATKWAAEAPSSFADILDPASPPSRVVGRTPAPWEAGR